MNTQVYQNLTQLSYHQEVNTQLIDGNTDDINDVNIANDVNDINDVNDVNEVNDVNDVNDVNGTGDTCNDIDTYYTDNKYIKTIIPDNIKMHNHIRNEIYAIHYEIERLTAIINDYTKGVDILWENKILPFVHSNDCSIMDGLMDSRSGYKKFNELMTSTSKFKIIIVSHKRLWNRYNFLKAQYKF